MDGEQRAESYKDCEIVCLSSNGAATFSATATITWRTRQGSTIAYFVRSAVAYPTHEAAVAAILQVAKTWIDTFGFF